jgi:hypothetical protein
MVRTLLALLFAGGSEPPAARAGDVVLRDPLAP